jgi:hypothetical protein
MLPKILFKKYEKKEIEEKRKLYPFQNIEILFREGEGGGVSLLTTSIIYVILL